MFDKSNEKIELAGGQVGERTLGRDQRAAAGIERPTSELIGGAGEPLRRRRCAGSAQYGPDAGKQLARVERLGHIVVGAELEADDAVGLAVAGGQENEGNGIGAAQFAA